MLERAVDSSERGVKARLRGINRHRLNFALALGFATLVAAGLLAFHAWQNHTFVLDFLLWNLFLAWVPLVLALYLASILRRKSWSSWEALIVSLLWLLFLPNSLYLVSDFIHIQDVASVNVVYDVVMFTSFIYTGLILGMSSLYLVHLELRARLRSGAAAWLIGLILLVCSFAIYLGRDLRWNTWDVLLSPAGLLFDVSERVLHPGTYPDMFVTVIGFFVLFASMYLVAWHSIKLLRSSDIL